MNKPIIRSLGKMDAWKMFDGMKCQSCNRFPSPYYRFICDGSHLFCAYCVQNGVCVKFDKSGASCWLPLEDQRKRVAGGSEKGAEPQSDAKCQKPVRRTPADPVYTSFFNNAMWNCPGTVDVDEEDDSLAGGCTQVLKGEKLYEHLQTEHYQSDQQSDDGESGHDWNYNYDAFEMQTEKKVETGSGGKKK